MDQSLSAVMRNINDALRLDDDSHNKEAYLKYLDCVLCITCNLQQYVRTMGGDVVITKQVTKQVKLAQQCVDRVAVLVENIGSSQRPVVLTSPLEEIREEMSRVAAKPRPFILVPPLPSEPTANTFARAKVNSPMEVAYKQNQQLMAAYRARLKRMIKRDPGTFNLSLTIQRKMAENLAIAKRTEMALAKKMQERQERLEEQAAKRFATPIGMSEEEQEQRQIYKQILEYEQDAKWLQAWREKLTTSPREPELICQLIQEILRCRDHPLTLLLKRYQHKVYEKIYPIVANKRHKLEAVVVPLDPTLWPPELCPVIGKSFPHSGGDEERKEGEENEDEGIQSDQDAMFSSVTQEGGGLQTERECNPGAVDLVEKDLNESVPRDVPGELKEKSEPGASCEVSTDYNVDCGCSVSDSEQTAVGGSTDTSIPDNTEESTHTDCQTEEALHEKPPTSVSKSDKPPTAVSKSDKPPTAVMKSDNQSMGETDPSSVANKGNDNDPESITTVDSPGSQNLAESSEIFTSKTSPQEIIEQNTALSDHSAPDSMAQIVEDTKENISEAISRGEHLQTQLTSEQKKAARVLRQISQDYETYNAENMDDLFDEEEEEGEEKANISLSRDQSSDPSLNRSSRTSGTFTPQSSTEPNLLPSLSVSSQSSFGEADDSGSGSGSLSSTQDFPSLPPVDAESRWEIERLSKEAYQRHVKNISDDVHRYMEKLLILFTIAYEQLDCPLGRDQCYASLEETFFKPLWKFLLMLFRLANYKEELSVACKMTQKHDCPPRDMGVTDKLCLMPAGGKGSSSSASSAGEQRATQRPYSQAISHLSCIRDHYTMLSKLECVVKVVHLIFDSIKEFYLSEGCAPSDVPSVGADDLLPVMTYVVMQSHLPSLVSECQAMAEFIHEGYMMGQEGYCLTTLETAVSFLVSSDLSEPISPT
ncbi:hypothetical protein ACOMHN_057607 [Nucella lapillus]